MKITITYIPAEAQTVDTILRFLRGMLPGAKVRKSTVHPPQICVYLTCNLTEKPCDATEKA